MLLFAAIFSLQNCFTQKQNINIGLDRSFEKIIILEDFPSKDTVSITFYKKDSWFVTYKMRNLLIPPLSNPCHNCDKIFTDAFMNTLVLLKPEQLPSKDCRVVIDTVYEGKPVVKINDFYSTSDLQKEIISIRNENMSISISYLEPRNALKYCKHNKERLQFIKYSEILRNTL
jgi:hypothetical protein